MSLTNTEYPLGLRLAQALANPLFPKLDNALRSGRHISADDLDNHSFLLEFHDELDSFYGRYQAELIKAPESFFYLRPRPSSELGTSVLAELDMLVGKVLCYLYLSPERLANEGVFSITDLQEELLNLADERQLLRMVTQRSGGSDLDKRKLLERMRTSLRRLQRLGMVAPLGQGERFRVNEAVFRFGADVRGDEDPKAVLLRMIREGEAIVPDDEPPTGDGVQDDVEDELDDEQPGLDI